MDKLSEAITNELFIRFIESGEEKTTINFSGLDYLVTKQEEKLEQGSYAINIVIKLLENE